MVSISSKTEFKGLTEQNKPLCMMGNQVVGKSKVCMGIQSEQILAN